MENNNDRIPPKVNEVTMGQVQCGNKKGTLVKLINLDASQTIGYTGSDVFYKIIPEEIAVKIASDNEFKDNFGNIWVLKK